MPNYFYFKKNMLKYLMLLNLFCNFFSPSITLVLRIFRRDPTVHVKKEFLAQFIIRLLYLTDYVTLSLIKKKDKR